MNLLITALGSYGDVLPMVGLAQAMKTRGHQATIITNPYFQQIVEEAGAGFLPIGTVETYLELTRHPDLWHPVRGPIGVIKNSVCLYLRELYELIDQQCQREQTVLVAHCLDYASRTHQDKHGTPVASVHFAPICLRSVHQAPLMFSMLLEDGWPRWFKRTQYWLADRVADRLVGQELNSLRADLGLKPARGIFDKWMFSPELVLALFPDWFAPPQPDWPANTTTTGFPLWDPAGMVLADEVEVFLQSGEPPLVFAPGSAMTEGHEFFEAAVDACQRLGRRGILCTKYREQLPESLPDGVRCFGFVPFSQLLPRAAALVHHGGIGTCAQGLAAGLPQVVMPMAYDQLDNATRLKRLGVAKILRRNKFRGPKLASYLEELLASDQVRSRARECAARMDGKRSLEESCDLLEKLDAGCGK